MSRAKRVQEHRIDGTVTSAGYRLGVTCLCGFWSGWQPTYAAARARVQAHIDAEWPEDDLRTRASASVDVNDGQMTIFDVMEG